MDNTLLIGDSFVDHTKLLGKYSKTFFSKSFPSTTMIGLKNKNVIDKIKPFIKKNNIKNLVLMFGYVDIAGDVFMKETQTISNINKIMKIIINNFNIVITELKQFNLKIFVINPILTPFYKNKQYYNKNCINFTIEKKLDNLEKKCDKLFKTYFDRMNIAKKYIDKYCKDNKLVFIDMNPLLKFIVDSNKIIYNGEIATPKKPYLDHHYISPIFLIIYLISIYNKNVQKNGILNVIEKLIKDYKIIFNKIKNIDSSKNFFDSYTVKFINNKLKIKKIKNIYIYKKKYLKYKKKYFDLIEQSGGNGLHNFLIKYGGASMSATTESAAGKKVL